jgi:murein DD-endopeptidase MepM/ murein hydrolase activator NlpD
LITLCGALIAGLFVINEVSAGAPANHLPTPAVVRTPGAVVEWKRPTPTALPETEGWMEVSSAELGLSLTSMIAPETESSPQAVPTAIKPLPGAPQVRLPMSGPVTQRYGCSPFYTGVAGPGCPADAFWFHDGVDIGAPVGTPVQAGMAGLVIFAGPDGDGPLCNQGYRGYGLAVIVDDEGGWPPGRGWPPNEGSQTLYAHLSRVDVTVGQTVTSETVIGLSGDTGCVSGAHLHFGLRHDGELVDPLAVAK